MRSCIALAILLAVFAAPFAQAKGVMVCTCYLDSQSNQMSVRLGHDTINGVAWGTYDDYMITTGYGILNIETNKARLDSEQMACAGFLEGFLTKDRIWQLFQNIMNTQSVFNGTRVEAATRQFLSQNQAWTTLQVSLHAAKNASSDEYQYWQLVSLLLDQFNGLVLGYNQYQTFDKQLSANDFWLMNSMGDMDDIIPAMKRKLTQDKRSFNRAHDYDYTEEQLAEFDYRSHCSAIIKPIMAPDGSITDIYVSHEMWSNFLQMLQIYKHYNFNLNNPAIASRRISMASYPGFLSSEDDFYILGDSKMAVIETTNNVYNLSLYDLLTPSSVLSWVRVMVANRMSSNGQSWQRTMSRWNSGTYNNQWMVVDFKLFQFGQRSLAPNFLVIGEQLPGYYRTQDVTPVINNQGYWPSYNIPFFVDGFNLSGYAMMEQQRGITFSYAQSPRANIFRQRQSSVKDLGSMQKLMRYNDWQNDPLSLGCPKYALASRYDLAPPNVPMCPQLAFGAINAKVTSAMMTIGRNMQASVVAGPTHDQQPVFAWTDQVSQKFNTTSHIGQPQHFGFEWFLTSPSKF